MKCPLSRFCFLISTPQVNKTNKDTAMRVLVNREAAMSLRPYFEVRVQLTGIESSQ